MTVSGKKRFSMVLASVLMLGGSAFVAPSLLHAQNAPPAPAAAAAPATLDRNMGVMNRAWRTIKAGAADKTKNEATLAALVQMQTATLAAKTQMPPAIEKLTGDEKNKKLNQYRTMMSKLLRQELELEDQIVAGQNDKAAATITAIEDIQKAGHKDFRPEE